MSNGSRSKDVFTTGISDNAIVALISFRIIPQLCRESALQQIHPASTMKLGSFIAKHCCEYPCTLAYPKMIYE